MDEELNNNVPAAKGAFSRFVSECIRVLKVTKKPNRTEYMTVAKIAAIGVLVIGLLGFILFSLKQLIITP